MPLKYGNRIKVNASGAPSTGTFILGTPAAGYQSFSSAIPSITTGDTIRYVIEEGASWEIGTGTYDTTGPRISRTAVIQSSAGGTSLVNFTANAVMMLTVASGDYVSNPNSVFSGAITETVYAITGSTPAINIENGTVQTWTLPNNSFPTSSLTSGQSVTLMIDDGSAFTVTWPSVVWKSDNGTAPNLNLTGYTAIALWNVNGTLYGARIGNG